MENLREEPTIDDCVCIAADEGRINSDDMDRLGAELTLLRERAGSSYRDFAEFAALQTFMVKHRLNESTPSAVVGIAGRALRALESLLADAQRFQGLRLIMLEHNEALQEKFFDVLEQVVPLDPDALPTPEQLNEGIDAALLECAKLRRQCKGVNCTSNIVPINRVRGGT